MWMYAVGAGFVAWLIIAAGAGILLGRAIVIAEREQAKNRARRLLVVV